MPLETQITATGATWLDRQLIAREPVATGNGFGAEIRDAMEARSHVLEEAGLAQRQGNGFHFERNLIETLRGREVSEATDAIAQRTGLPHRPSPEGDYVSGLYRERVTLASGRFAMIDDGMGFQLVPWCQCHWNIAQKWRCKIPHFAIFRNLRLLAGTCSFGRSSPALGFDDDGPDWFGQEVGVLAQAVAGSRDLYDDRMMEEAV